MASIEFLTLSGDVRKRLVSGTSTIDFGSIKIGASQMEIKEVSSNFDFGNKRLANVADPSGAQDVATKSYVDSIASGLDPKLAVDLATVAVLPSTPTYANGTAGVGATLTAGANGALSLDNVAVTAGMRVLVKDQANQAHNGIYVVTAAGDGSNPYVLTRATDFDGSPANEVNGGEFTFIKGGDTLKDTGWVVASPNDAATIGTTNIIFTQFSAAGVVGAGAGLVQNGTDIDVAAGDASITVNADSIQIKRLSTGAIGLDATDGIKVNVDGTTLEIATNALQIKALGVSTSHLAADSVTKEKINADVAGLGLGQNLDGSLEVNVDGSTIEIATDSLQVKDLGITSGKLAANSVTAAKLNSDVAGLGLELNGTSNALDVKVDNNSLEIATDTVQIKALGVATSHLAADSVTKEKINSDVAGLGLAQNVDGSLEVSVGDSIKIVSDAVAVDYAISKTNDNGLAITANKIVYVKANGNVDLAQATTVALYDFELGIVEDASIASAAAGKIILKRGAIVPGFSGLTPGKKLYVSRTTAGEYIQSLSGFVAGEYVYSIGRAIDSSHVAFDPCFEYEY